MPKIITGHTGTDHITMKTINLKVTDTKVIITDKPKRITSGNIGNTECVLDLDPVFDNLIVRVSFNGEFRIVVDGRCDVPSLRKGACKIGVYGYTLDENGSYSLRVSPSPVYLHISEGSFNDNDVAANDVQSTEIEDYYAKVEKLINSNKFAIDCKLSEESSNAIANSAVAKVLGGGRLLGIETIYDYESLMDFQLKYFDFENECLLIGDDEFVILLALDDIYDESGEYGDNECLVKKAMYIYTAEDASVIGDISDSDIQQIIQALNSHSTSINSINAQLKTLAPQSELDKLVNVLTSANRISSDSYMLRGAGVYVIDCDSTLVYTAKHPDMLTLSKGEIFIVTEETIDSKYRRSVTAFTHQGIKHIVDVSIENIEDSRYIDKTEAETLIDEKMSEIGTSTNSEKWELIEHWTNEDEELVTIKFNFSKRYSKIKVFVDLKRTNSGLGLVFVKVNNITSKTLISPTMSSNQYCIIDCEMLDGYISGSHSSSSNRLTGGGNYQVFGHEIEKQYIDALFLTINTSGKYFPQGIEIALYGVEA